jgi:hypothetical protein
MGMQGILNPFIEEEGVRGVDLFTVMLVGLTSRVCTVLCTSLLTDM